MARKKREIIKKSLVSSSKNNADSTSSDELSENISETSLSERIREIVSLLLIGISVFLIYSNNLKGPLVFDDEQNIRDNRYIRIKEISFNAVKDAAFKSHAPNRPIPNISFALNYYFHQYNMKGYHVVNILIHIITGILLYFFIKITMGIEGVRSQKSEDSSQQPTVRLSGSTELTEVSPTTADSQNTSHFSLPTSHFLIPFLSSLIWLVHPLQTQSVSYIVQRMNSMAAMFYIMSFLFYVHARLAKGGIKKPLLFAGSLIAGVSALASKEIAGSLPFFIFLYEWYFFQDLNREWIKRYLFIFGGILFFLIIFALIYMGTNPLDKILQAYQQRDFTMSQRVLTEFRVIIFYISLIIFPHPSRLNLTHDFPLSYSLFDPINTLFSILIIAGLIGLAVYLAKKERLISFCIIWYFGNLVIESSVIGLELIFEHRNYLPSMLVCLIGVNEIIRVLKNQTLRVFKTIRVSEKIPGYILISVIAIILSFWTHERNGVWSSDFSLWKDCVEKSPKNVRPYNNLGISLSAQGKIEEAMNYFKQAIQIKPDYAYAHNNLGYALALQGKTEEAIPYYLKAIQIIPGYVDANYNLANALSKQEKYEEAAKHYSNVLMVMPDHEKAHNGLGAVLLHLKKHDEAIYHYSESLKINPDFAETHNNLGLVFADQEKNRDAIRYYSEAIRLNPEFAEAHYNMGLALAKTGNLNEAVSHFTKAKKIKPDYAEAHNNLGNALAGLGKMNEAIESYSQALKVNPEFADAHYNLGVAMAGNGKTDEAVKHYSEALRIKPDFADAHYNLGVILAREGKTDEAIEHYKRVIQISPDADAHYNIGLLLANKGNFKEAVQHYTEALKIKPELENARRNMETALKKITQ